MPFRDFDFSQLLKSRLPGLVLFARQWDPNAVEDCVHEAFLKLAQEVALGKTPENPAAWLYTVVRNLSINAAKKNRQFREYGEREAWFTRPKPTAGQVAWEEKMDAEFLTEKLGTLPLEQREVITSHIWGDQSFREIAAWTGRSFSTVRRQFHEGIETLRKYSE